MLCCGGRNGHDLVSLRALGWPRGYWRSSCRILADREAPGVAVGGVRFVAIGFLCVFKPRCCSFPVQRGSCFGFGFGFGVGVGVGVGMRCCPWWRELAYVERKDSQTAPRVDPCPCRPQISQMNCSMTQFDQAIPGAVACVVSSRPNNYEIWRFL